MKHPAHARSEQEIIEKARQGDDRAFEQLVMLFTPRLFRVVNRMTGDASETEAIMQETFFRIWQALPRYNTEKPFFPYLVTIAANIFRDQWRKSRRLDFGGFDALEEVLPDKNPCPEEKLEQKELLQCLAKAVAELPPAYRAVIALKYDAGMKYQQIAKALGLPVNTVRTHLRRAKRLLKSTLEDTLPGAAVTPNSSEEF